MVPAEIATNQQEWAVVTGASSGIGRAFALELARRGHPILLVARRRDELQRVAAEITAGGGRAEPLVADLASAGGVEAVARAAEALGDVGVLVNNAGVGSYGPFLEQPAGRDAAQVALNIDAVVALTRGFLPRMVARGRGQIINVASVLAFMPTPYFATYAATKAFVLSFSEALAHELRGTGVRVLAASPGVVKTEFSGVAGFPEQESALPKLTPDAVVRATLRAAKSGRVVRVVGPARLLALLAAITPRPLMRRIMGRIFAPRRPAPSSQQHLLTRTAADRLSHAGHAVRRHGVLAIAATLAAATPQLARAGSDPLRATFVRAFGPLVLTPCTEYRITGKIKAPAIRAGSGGLSPSNASCGGRI